MASSSTSTWVPQGRHEVQIGPSLNKALKARKGGPPPQVKRTGPPEKDFYSFRYNFKPPSVDTSKPGSIEVTRGKEATTVVVEHPSSQPGENYRYNGTEASAKEFDCVLIYDEETGSYKLEKLESYITLSYDGKTAASLPTSSAPTPSQADASVDTLIDAEGESDDEMPNNFAAPTRHEEEESEEEGELEPVVVPPPPPARPVKPLPPPKPLAAAPAPAPRPTKAAPQRKSTKKAAPPPPPPIPADLEEEDLQFGRPATKRAKPSPPVALSLPGASSSGWVAPPAPTGAASTSAPHPHRAASPIAVQSDSDEDDWDPVPVDAEVPQEIDMNEFEQTLEAEMEAEMEMVDEEDGSEPEDFLADALPQAPDSAATPLRPPMSMGQLAGYSDDEYSSSEDSDDD